MPILVSLSDEDKKEIDNVSRGRYVNYEAKEGYQEGCFNSQTNSSEQ